MHWEAFIVYLHDIDDNDIARKLRSKMMQLLQVFEEGVDGLGGALPKKIL